MSPLVRTAFFGVLIACAASFSGVRAEDSLEKFVEDLLALASEFAGKLESIHDTKSATQAKLALQSVLEKMAEFTSRSRNMARPSQADQESVIEKSRERMRVTRTRLLDGVCAAERNPEAAGILRGNLDAARGLMRSLDAREFLANDFSDLVGEVTKVLEGVKDAAGAERARVALAVYVARWDDILQRRKHFGVSLEVVEGKGSGSDESSAKSISAAKRRLELAVQTLQAKPEVARILDECLSRLGSLIQPNAARAKLAVNADARLLGEALARYEKTSGRLPTTEQGLEVLVSMPTKGPHPERWHRQLEELPKDPWGRPYHYRNPAQKSRLAYDLWSAGQDGIDETADDIGNWGDQPAEAKPPAAAASSPGRLESGGSATDASRRRYEVLSDTAKERLREFFHDNRERLQAMTPEERRDLIKKAFERIEAEDKAAKGN